MYINIKSKYKKILWLIIGFLACCILTDKVLAYSFPNGSEFTQETIQNLWNTYFASTTPHDIVSTCSLNNSTCNHTFSESSTPFQYVIISQWNSSSNIYVLQFFRDLNEINFSYSSSGVTFSIARNKVQFQPNYSDIQYSYYPVLYVNYSSNSFILSNSNYEITYNNGIQNNYNAIGDFKHFAINFDLINNDTLLKYKNLDYNVTFLPDYLFGYKKITLTTDDKYYMLSGLSSGSVYIPIEDFINYGGRLSYYDNDLSSQPYDTYIQDYVTTEDGLYVRQDFNIDDYYGADWVMFSKYIYLEGEDNISYDIWVPNDIYESQVTITPNSSGGNTFDFDYKDSNGDIQSGQVDSVDLSQDSPLFNQFLTTFSQNTFGLASIITAPLSIIQNLDSTSCTPLVLPLPFLNSNLTLPCMYSFYENTFGNLFTLYQTITFGIVSYWVCVRFLQFIKEFKDPDHDEIEVVDL